MRTTSLKLWTLCGGLLLLTFSSYPPAAQADQKVCAPPPLVQSVAVSQPNVLFVFGNASTMGEFAYSSDFEIGRKYYGYFDPDKVYKYDNTKHYFDAVGDTVDDPSTSVVERAASLKSGGVNKVFSGNWLNWLTMRRMDIAKKVITGGRLGGDVSEYVLVGDTLEYQNHNEGDHWTRSFDDSGKKTGVLYTPFGGNKLLVRFSTFDRTHRDDGSVKFVPMFKFSTLTSTDIISGDATYDNVGETSFKGVDFTDPTNYVEREISCDEAPDIAPGSLTTNHCGGSSGCEADYWQTKGNCGTYPCDDFKMLNDTWVRDLQFRCGSYYLAVKVGDVGVDDPPQGVIQKVVGRVRLGYMKYNLGWGPSDSNPPGGQGDYFNDLSYDWTINGQIDYVSRLSDGGQVRVPVGKPAYIDSNQQYTDSEGNTVTVPILKIVKLINEDHPQGLTPVTETIKEAMRYFQQTSPAYRSDCDPESNKTDTLHGWCLTEQVPNFFVNDYWDPFHDTDYNQKISCAQSHIVYLTDGDPARDAKADEGADKRYDGSGIVPDDVSRTFTGNDGGTFLDDITFALHTEDQRSDITGDQLVKFHAIQCFDTTNAPSLIAGAKAGGFNDINEDGDITDSSEWDANGDGLPDNFYKAEDGYQLEKELLAIFTEISAQGSGGAVATVSQETRAGDLIVRGAFFHKVNANRTKGIWNGHLEVWWPDADSGLYDFEIYGLSFCSDILFGSNTKNCWDAGEMMSPGISDNRLILTLLEREGTASGGIKPWYAPEMFEFNTDNVAELQPFLELTVDTTDKAEALIQWTRGKVNTDGNPLDSSGTRLDSTVQYRDRKKDLDSGPQWLLGDIIFSTPVVVGAPTLSRLVAKSPHAAEYLAYRQANFYRPKMIYVGGNDGMLHAFLLSRWDSTTQEWVQDPNDPRCTDCGKEVWAYIPSIMLPDLKKLAKSTYGTATCQHIAMVDLAPQAFDVYIDHDGDGDREWRTVLLGGLRGGGDMYFAIDVTEPPVDTAWDKTANPNPKILWEYSVLKNLAVAYEDAASPSNILITRPYADADLYQRIRDLPLTWSEPVIGRMTIPSDVSFNVWRPDYTQTTAETALQPTWTKESISYADDGSQYRHVAFMGGGFRIFREPNWDGFALYPSPDFPDTRKALFKPNLVAIDVETGCNLFQETWALMVKYAPSDAWSSDPTDLLWDLHTVSGNTIPYALSHPIALDAWNQEDNTLGEDGFVDRLYFGDLMGNFYALKLGFSDPESGIGSLFAKLEMRRTKQVNTTDSTDAAYRTNYYRYLYQPINGKFGSSWSPDNTSIIVAFGTGKLDDVDGTIYDDFNDDWMMSLFNVSDKVQEVTVAEGSDLNELIVDASNVVLPKPNRNKKAYTVQGTNFRIEIEQLACPTTSYTYDPLTQPCTEDASGIRSNCCNWATSSGGDCCETGDCRTDDPCWHCVYDFSTPGERVIDRPLIAGGLVFFSTALPAEGDPCDVSEGTGNLYVFGYACRPFPSGFEVVQPDGTTQVTAIMNDAGEKIGEKITFPGQSGVPSRPILDSSGKNVLIQKSNSELVKVPVNLMVKTTQVTGWQER